MTKKKALDTGSVDSEACEFFVIAAYLCTPHASKFTLLGVYAYLHLKSFDPPCFKADRKIYIDSLLEEKHGS